MNCLILGCGAIGSNLAAYLASDIRDEHQITVIDYDAVEERNIRAGTQFYLREQIGLPKVEALQFNIYKQFNRQIDMAVYKITGDNNLIFNRYDLVIDCLDNFEARRVTTTACRNVPCVHLGFSTKTMTFSILWNERYVPPEDEEEPVDICELTGSSSFVKLTSSLGSLVVQNFLLYGNKREYVGNKYKITEIL